MLAKRFLTTLKPNYFKPKYICNSKYNYSKDIKVGHEIHRHLSELKVETPLLLSPQDDMAAENKISEISKNVNNILKLLNLDLTNDSLKDTPKRVSKMFVNEIFKGLDYNNFPKCTKIKNQFNYDSFVIQKNINVESVCEHHLVHIDGICNIGYIPEKYIIGLSKLNRIADFFSRRPQVQERLTEQILHTLQYILETEHVAVYITAKHYCIKCRGIQDVGSYTITSKLAGKFQNDFHVRNEFNDICRAVWKKD